MASDLSMEEKARGRENPRERVSANEKKEEENTELAEKYHSVRKSTNQRPCTRRIVDTERGVRGGHDKHSITQVVVREDTDLGADVKEDNRKWQGSHFTRALLILVCIMASAGGASAIGMEIDSNSTLAERHWLKNDSLGNDGAFEIVTALAGTSTWAELHLIEKCSISDGGESKISTAVSSNSSVSAIGTALAGTSTRAESHWSANIIAEGSASAIATNQSFISKFNHTIIRRVFEICKYISTNLQTYNHSTIRWVFLAATYFLREDSHSVYSQSTAKHGTNIINSAYFDTHWFDMYEFHGDSDCYISFWLTVSLPYIWHIMIIALRTGGRQWRLLLYAFTICAQDTTILWEAVPVFAYNYPTPQDRCNFHFLRPSKRYRICRLSRQIYHINSAQLCRIVAGVRTGPTRYWRRRQIPLHAYSKFDVARSLFQRGRSCRSNISGDGHGQT